MVPIRYESLRPCAYSLLTMCFGNLQEPKDGRQYDTEEGESQDVKATRVYLFIY